MILAGLFLRAESSSAAAAAARSFVTVAERHKLDSRSLLLPTASSPRDFFFSGLLPAARAEKRRKAGVQEARFNSWRRALVSGD